MLDKILKLFNLQSTPNRTAWKSEDHRLPIWVRKVVSKYKQKHNVYTDYPYSTKKIFYGKKYVYKFTWYRENISNKGDFQGICSPSTDYKYHEKWAKEPRRY